MNDILDQIEAVRRKIGTAGAARRMVLRREYDAPVEDVWDALPTPSGSGAG